MRGLLGDRFLRKFAGELNFWRKHPNSKVEGQNPEDDCEEPGADAVLADTKDMPIQVESEQQDQIGSKADKND